MKESVSWGVLNRFLNDNRDLVVDAYIRKSSRGNTHVKINLDREYLKIQEFEFRAFLRDDPFRIKLDLVRMCIDGKLFDTGGYKPGGASGTQRLWDWKIIDTEMYQASDWVKIWEKEENVKAGVDLNQQAEVAL